MAKNLTSSPRYSEYTSSSSQASRTLSRTRKKDTKCEVALRKALWRRGLRFRKHYAGAPGTPDIAFPTARVAIFCDGDFWHGRNWEQRRRKLAKGSNSGYWVPKIERNRERDRITRAALEERGWLVMRFWETDILRDPETVAGAIDQRLTEVRSR